MTEHEIKRFVVNVGGRGAMHHAEAAPIATEVAKAIVAAKPNLDPSIIVHGKNGGLEGSMQAFGEAYNTQSIDWVPVLTPELDDDQYAPPISRNNALKDVKKDNTERLAEIIKGPGNILLIVTTGGSGTLEEVSSALCENEFRIKWPIEAAGRLPFPVFIVGDAAVAQWRPILHEAFSQMRDTHPLVERLTWFISTYYVNKGFLGGQIVRILSNECGKKGKKGEMMDYTDLITINPARRSGKPCIRNTRMTVQDVLEYLAAGMTPEEIVDEFPNLTLEDIRVCLAFAADSEKRTAYATA